MASDPTSMLNALAEPVQAFVNASIAALNEDKAR